MKVRFLIILIGLFSFSLYADQIDPVLLNTSSHKLDYGWTKVIEKWGVQNSGYIRTKIIINNRDGETVRELYGNFDNDYDHCIANFIEVITTKDKILISTYETNMDKSLRSWKFEIINTDNIQIFYKEYLYQTSYSSFRLNTVAKTKKIDSAPYYFAVDDMYLYYINDKFTAIVREEIKFNNITINDDMMPSPREITYNNNSLEILYDFPTIFSSESDQSHTVTFNLSKSN